MIKSDPFDPWNIESVIGKMDDQSERYKEGEGFGQRKKGDFNESLV